MTFTPPRSWVIRAGLAVMVAAGVACTEKPASNPLPVLPIGGDFALTDHNREPFALSSLRGKVVIVFFGYSMCPDFCPITLSKLATVASQLGDDASKIKTLYISVDPERDTPEVLKEDLASFRLDALGLTGTKAEIDKVVALFGASYEIVPTPTSVAKYTVSHSTSVYVLDTQGRVRLELPYEATVDEVLRGIRAVIAAESSPIAEATAAGSAPATAVSAASQDGREPIRLPAAGRDAKTVHAVRHGHPPGV